MTPLFKVLLITHVLLGLLGAMATYAVWLGVLKKNPSIRFLKNASLVSFVSFMGSWFSGGYYYVKYYGDMVRPRILGGNYPWAHQIFTESKEHVFLFLPFAALALMVLVWCMGDRLGTDENLRKKTAFFAGAVTAVAIFITLAGIGISGGAR